LPFKGFLNQNFILRTLALAHFTVIDGNDNTNFKGDSNKPIGALILAMQAVRVNSISDYPASFLILRLAVLSIFGKMAKILLLTKTKAKFPSPPRNMATRSSHGSSRTERYKSNLSGVPRSLRKRSGDSQKITGKTLLKALANTS
jgi:hypothetical protein